MCSTCRESILSHEFRLVYSCEPDASVAAKPAIYREMHKKTQRALFQITEACLPPPEILGASYVEEVMNRESLFVDCCFLPKTMKESIVAYRLSVEHAVENALHKLREAGHTAEYFLPPPG